MISKMEKLVRVKDMVEVIMNHRMMFGAHDSYPYNRLYDDLNRMIDERGISDLPLGADYNRALDDVQKIYNDYKKWGWLAEDCNFKMLEDIESLRKPETDEGEESGENNVL